MIFKDEINTSLEILQNKMKELILFYQKGFDYQKMVYEFWNAKNVLGHITFWHESFAINISDLADDNIPKPLKGKLSEVNKLSVETTSSYSIEELIGRLQAAQKTIEKHIFNEAIGIIPYKKGSRGYSRKEHLDIVATHINKHLKDLKKKFK